MHQFCCMDEVKFEEALRNDLVKIVKNLVENKAFESLMAGRTKTLQTLSQAC